MGTGGRYSKNKTNTLTYYQSRGQAHKIRHQSWDVRSQGRRRTKGYKRKPGVRFLRSEASLQSFYSVHEIYASWLIKARIVNRGGWCAVPYSYRDLWFTGHEPRPPAAFPGHGPLFMTFFPFLVPPPMSIIGLIRVGKLIRLNSVGLWILSPPSC